MYHRLSRWLLMSFALVSSACSTNADGDVPIGTVSFQNGVDSYAGSTDTEMREAAATANFGEDVTCNADGDDGGGSDKSCLIRWTLSGMPAGAVVQSASITLHIADATANTYEVYGMRRPWSESAASWTHATASEPWAAPGDAHATDRGAIIGKLTGDGNVTVSLNDAGVALVQSWVNGDEANAGILIADASKSDGIDFASSEHEAVEFRPKLSITYDAGLPPPRTPSPSTEPELLVAFIGDQGANGMSDSVLELIRSEGAAAVVHNGDFDYENNPPAWNARIDRILGPSYPYFAIVGNHDASAWDGPEGYAAFIAARHERVAEMDCQGELGVKAICHFRGLQIVESCVGTDELAGHGDCSADSSEQVGFIRDALANDDAVWSVCAWHKNQNDMQVGTKSDEVGWDAYRECMAEGAMIATGHEHSYARTLTLTNVGDRAAAHGATGVFGIVELGAGRTFVTVSGLAGASTRDYDATQHDDDTWWASYYSANKWLKNGLLEPGSGTSGALFVRFHVEGDARRAEAYFKDVNGRVVDQFTLRAL
jgi:hypothetical protein